MKILKFLVIALLFSACTPLEDKGDDYNIIQWVKIGSEYDKYNRLGNAETIEEFCEISADTSEYYDLTTRITYHSSLLWERTDNGTEKTIAKLKCKRENEAKLAIAGLKRLEKINCN